MNIIRFDIVMEDYPDVRRVIEMRGNQTFEDLHKAVLTSVDFDFSQLASFYLCNDEWERKAEIMLIDMDPDENSTSLVMADLQLKDFIIKTGQKLVYEYDFVLMWQFRVEVKAISPEEKEDNIYPALVYTEGKAPEQYDTKEKYPLEVTDEDSQYINELKVKNMDMLKGDEDEFSAEKDIWDEGNWEEGGAEDKYWDEDKDH